MKFSRNRELRLFCTKYEVYISWSAILAAESVVDGVVFQSRKGVFFGLTTDRQPQVRCRHVKVGDVGRDGEETRLSSSAVRVVFVFEEAREGKEAYLVAECRSTAQDEDRHSSDTVCAKTATEGRRNIFLAGRMPRLSTR